MELQRILKWNGKKVIRVTLISLCTIFLILIIGFMLLFRSKIATILTIKKVDGAPLYVMKYQGGYGFDDLLKQGVKSDRELEQFVRNKLMLGDILRSKTSKAYECSCFSSGYSKNELVFGRNFDWDKHPGLLLYTDPPDGYASVSMVDLSYLGVDINKVQKLSLSNKAMLLAAPYIPEDGMNEYGLAVAILSVPYGEPTNDKNKKTISISNAMRLMLDHAKDVEEAILLLNKYNVYMEINPAHLFVSDSKGTSAVIEYINGKMIVTRNKEKWDVATNFVVNDWNGSYTGYDGEDRYFTAYNTLRNNYGNIYGNDAMDILNKVSQKNTIWSVVYNLKSGNISLAMNKNYNDIKNFKFKMKNQ